METSTQKNPGKNNKAPVSDPAMAASGLTPEQLAQIKAQVAKAGEGLEDRKSDVVGYWVPEQAPIHCKPMHVKLFDGQIDAGKPSALVTVIALSPTVVSTSSDEDDSKKIGICKKGDIIGIWMKPGMRDMLNTAGAETTIEYTGQKKVHKKPGMNPMKMFSVKAKGGARLPIEEDRRDKSASVATMFDVKKPKGSASPDMDADADVGDDGNF